MKNLFLLVILIETLVLGCVEAVELKAVPANAIVHARSVLVLYGWDPKLAEKPVTWPADTMCGELFQAPLEWLGFEVEYHDIGKLPLPKKLDARFAAVLVDAEIHIPVAEELALAKWLVAQKESGLSLLFTGGFPFANEDAVEVIHSGLGLRGTAHPIPRTKEISIASLDETMLNAETKFKAQVHDFRDLQAPEKARVFASLKGVDDEGGSVHYDPVFLASWGGVWLEPCIAFRASADSCLFHVDPYKFLAAWLGARGAFPAPDTSTRDGRRIFYSHIDGDGFPTPAEFKGHPLCGEIIRDRILKVFPLPVTVSFIEADLRGEVEGLNGSDAPHYQEVARSILQLPNVRTATHTYSHPYVWFPTDSNPGTYEEPNIKLKPSVQYPTIITQRELRGSVDFINQTVAPREKPVELILWSGNCRPGVEALRMTREMGLENMNGGNTIISRLYPGLAGIASRVMPWDGELQIHASNQNEFMYANGFNGPFYGGFAEVVDTFERTEKPRRLKPVNVYYHFYSAQFLGSLRALEKICRWSLEQNLHSMTALDYAKLTRDSYNTRIYDLGPRRWMMVNAGHQRTFRLPAHIGKPRMEHCSGVTGWKLEGDQIFIHTLGQPVTELELMDVNVSTPPHLILTESSADIQFEDLTPYKAVFRVEDFRAVQTVFSGLKPGALCNLTINGQSSSRTASASGSLDLQLPPKARVTLDATHSRYATTP